jgi:arginine deiminase
MQEASSEAHAAASHAQTEVERLQQKLNQRGVEVLVLQQEVSQMREEMQVC